MKDQFEREISYLRISVTDRCNFRCKYCMGEEGVSSLSHEDILSYEKIAEITKIMAGFGVTKVRITGGEPLVRKDIVKLIEMINEIKGIDDIAMTTNGSLLYPLIDDIKNAGLNRINFSLDTLNKDKFNDITRRDEFDNTIKAIDAAIDKGFKVKINTVLLGGFNDDEIEDFINLTKDKDIEVRFIELMPIGEASNRDKDTFISNEKVLENNKLIKIKDDGVASLYKIEGYKGKVGLISPLSHKFCMDCNRIRLTADGKLKPCLHSRNEIDLNGLTEDELKSKIKDAIFYKPKAHHLEDSKSESLRSMNMIGG